MTSVQSHAPPQILAYIWRGLLLFLNTFVSLWDSCTPPCQKPFQACSFSKMPCSVERLLNLSSRSFRLLLARTAFFVKAHNLCRAVCSRFSNVFVPFDGWFAPLSQALVLVNCSRLFRARCFCFSNSLIPFDSFALLSQNFLLVKFTRPLRAVLNFRQSLSHSRTPTVNSLENDKGRNHRHWPPPPAPPTSETRPNEASVETPALASHRERANKNCLHCLGNAITCTHCAVCLRTRTVSLLVRMGTLFSTLIPSLA